MGVKHGMHGTPTYISWMSMKSRCNNPKHPLYSYYGGIGVRVCPRWAEFMGFLSDMGKRPLGHELGRIDTAGNYEPSNCEWVLHSTQQKRIRSKSPIKFGGKKQSLLQWSRDLHIRESELKRRLAAGWPIELAFTSCVTSSKD